MGVNPVSAPAVYDTVDEPAENEVRVVRTVRVVSAPAAMFDTVTRPVPLIVAVPAGATDTFHAQAAS